MAGIADKMKQAGVRKAAPRGTLWRGPEHDGITQSLLNRFLGDRERFRLLVVEGLQGTSGWDHKLGYGNMWHCCEEALAARRDWRADLLKFAKAELKEYPTQVQVIDKYYEVCKQQFPIYVQWWAEHPDVQQRTPVFQEQEFAVVYRLPSGRTVKLLGKFDAVDLIGEGKDRGGWLQENKTKGDIYEPQMRRQLTFDLQTMFYLVALLEHQRVQAVGPLRDVPILGVRYNVIRRPLSGGKGSIVQHQATKGAKCPKCKGEGDVQEKGSKSKWESVKCPKCDGAGRIGAKPEETKQAYYARLGAIIQEDPGSWFMRWQVRVYPGDVVKFRRRFLDPILEQLCDWWHVIRQGGDPFDPRNCGLHWQHPFGTYNVLDEGGSTDLDEYLATGSEVGLERVSTLFPELPSKAGGIDAR